MRNKTIFTAPLKPHEQSVLDLAIDGLTIQQMADALYRSNQRISGILCEIHAKAGVSGRPALIAKYYKNELSKVA